MSPAKTDVRNFMACLFGHALCIAALAFRFCMDCLAFHPSGISIPAFSR